MGGERRHATEAVGSDTAKENGMIRIAGDDQFVQRIAAIIVERAVDQMGLCHGQPRTRVPSGGAGAAGLMALDAIFGKIRPDAIFEAVIGVSSSRERRKTSWTDRRTEVPRLAQE